MDSRIGFVASVMTALAVTCTVANAQGGFTPQPLTTTKVNDFLYLIRNNQSGNVSVLLSDDGVLLIDDKFAGDHDGIMEQLREITDEPVRWVINTHLHQDHSGGNAPMQSIGADVIASDNARRIMAETQDEGLPDLTFADYMRIHHGERAIELHYFGRGHTDGDIVIHMPEERIVFTGDLFAGYDPYVHLIHYAAGGSGRDWSRTLEKVLQLDFDVVIPGHSAPTDRATLEGYLAETIRLQDMVREMNRQQRSREDIAAMLQSEFGWSEFLLNFGLEGLIGEMQ